jgi:hypothetical protein
MGLLRGGVCNTPVRGGAVRGVVIGGVGAYAIRSYGVVLCAGR